MPFPFEADFDDIQANMDVYVDEVFGCLESEFLVMPKGPGFVEFPIETPSVSWLVIWSRTPSKTCWRKRAPAFARPDALNVCPVLTKRPTSSFPTSSTRRS